MLNPCYPAPIWLIWKELPILEKLPFLVLCILGGYSFFLAATVVRLRSAASVQANIVRLRKRVRNLQKATVAAFYLLGFGIFAGLQFAYCIVENSAVPLGFIVDRNLQLHFAFAGNGFLVLFIVHVVQWFIANQVNALRSQTSS
jgi:hypothetical protein